MRVRAEPISALHRHPEPTGTCSQDCRRSIRASSSTTAPARTYMSCGIAPDRSPNPALTDRMGTAARLVGLPMRAQEERGLFNRLDSLPRMPVDHGEPPPDRCGASVAGAAVCRLTTRPRRRLWAKVIPCPVRGAPRQQPHVYETHAGTEGSGAGVNRWPTRLGGLRALRHSPATAVRLTGRFGGRGVPRGLAAAESERLEEEPDQK